MCQKLSEMPKIGIFDTEGASPFLLIMCHKLVNNLGVYFHHDFVRQELLTHTHCEEFLGVSTFAKVGKSGHFSVSRRLSSQRVRLCQR